MSIYEIAEFWFYSICNSLDDDLFAIFGDCISGVRQLFHITTINARKYHFIGPLGSKIEYKSP